MDHNFSRHCSKVYLLPSLLLFQLPSKYYSIYLASPTLHSSKRKSLHTRFLMTCFFQKALYWLTLEPREWTHRNDMLIRMSPPLHLTFSFVNHLTFITNNKHKQTQPRLCLTPNTGAHQMFQITVLLSNVKCLHRSLIQ